MRTKSDSAIIAIQGIAACLGSKLIDLNRAEESALPLLMSIKADEKVMADVRGFFSAPACKNDNVDYVLRLLDKLILMAHLEASLRQK